MVKIFVHFEFEDRRRRLMAGAQAVRLSGQVSRLRTVLGDKGASPRYIETVARKGYRFVEPVTGKPETRSANTPHHWSRPLLVYAAVAIVAAILAILVVRTRYDKFVPSQGSQASPTVPAR